MLRWQVLVGRQWLLDWQQLQQWGALHEGRLHHAARRKLRSQVHHVHPTPAVLLLLVLVLLLLLRC